jgi:hypothetical protein
MRRKQSATVDLKVRMKEPLRATLERSAKKRAVSLNAEAVDRLERSFLLDQILGDEIFADMLGRLVGITNLIKTRAQRESLDRLVEFRAELAAWVRHFGEAQGPHASPELGRLWDAYEHELMRPVQDEAKLKATLAAYRDAEDQMLEAAQSIGSTAAAAFATREGDRS